MLEKVFMIKIQQKLMLILNRSGIALMEIVSEPDLRSADEAALYIN